MSKKSKHQINETESKDDLAAFEQLPETTKELMRLKETEERTIGPKQVVVTRKIHEKARKREP